MNFLRNWVWVHLYLRPNSPNRSATSRRCLCPPSAPSCSPSWRFAEVEDAAHQALKRPSVGTRSKKRKIRLCSGAEQPTLTAHSCKHKRRSPECISGSRRRQSRVSDSSPRPAICCARGDVGCHRRLCHLSCFSDVTKSFLIPCEIFVT